MKQLELDAIIILPLRQEILCCRMNTVRQSIKAFVKLAHLNSLYSLVLTCQEAAWKHDKDFVNPTETLNQQKFLMQYL